ncbi:unnamed protein product, partial [Coregonus sp. 'balchen']
YSPEEPALSSPASSNQQNQKAEPECLYPVPDDLEVKLGRAGTSRVPDHLQAGFRYCVCIHQDLTEGPDYQGCPSPALLPSKPTYWTAIGTARTVSEEPSSPSPVHNDQQDQEPFRAHCLYPVPDSLEAKLGSRQGRCTDHLQANFLHYVSCQGSEGYQCALGQLPFPSLAALLSSWEPRQDCSLLYSKIIRRCPSPPPMVVEPPQRDLQDTQSAFIHTCLPAHHPQWGLPGAMNINHLLSHLPPAHPYPPEREDNVSYRETPRSPSLQPSCSTPYRGFETHQPGPFWMQPMERLQSYHPQPSHSSLTRGDESHQAGPSPSKRRREPEEALEGYPGPNCTTRRGGRSKTKSKRKILQTVLDLD